MVSLQSATERVVSAALRLDDEVTPELRQHILDRLVAPTDGILDAQIQGGPLEQHIVRHRKDLGGNIEKLLSGQDGQVIPALQPCRSLDDPHLLDRGPQDILLEDLHGFEVLGRAWLVKTRQLVLAGALFGPGAKPEEISQIDLQIYKWVCLLRANFARTLRRELRGSANITPHSLEREDFIDQLARITEECRANPEDLILEMIEDVTPTPANLRKIRECAEMGFGIAMDDLGRSHSPELFAAILAAQIPVREIKFDGRDLWEWKTLEPARRDFVSRAIDAGVQQVVFEGHFKGVTGSELRSVQDFVAPLLHTQGVHFLFEGTVAYPNS